METLKEYFIHNFFLVCLVISTIVMVLRSYRAKRGITVLMPVLVVSSVFLLSIIYAIEQFAAKHEDLLFLATLCCALGFIIRPFVLYFFIRISIDFEDKKWINYTILSLMGASGIVYLLSLFTFAPGLTHVIFYYTMVDGVITVIRGPLFYCSHVIVGVMMAFFIVYSIYHLQGRRKLDAIASLICAAFVGVAVILETLLIADNLLNTTVAIACLFYVVHLYQQALIHDPLTNLLDRKAYYSDIEKVENKITGVIVIDMNSLKELNDAEGHEAGDKALSTIASSILKTMDNRYMYAYRMGGDEFILISTSKKEGSIKKEAEKIQEALSVTPYSVSLGYAAKGDMTMPYKQFLEEADMMMYKNKEDYYCRAGKDRRKKNRSAF